MSRFGSATVSNIKTSIKNSIPKNTINTKESIWKQFREFCREKGYELLNTTTTIEIANILRDWAFNMKKKNGEDYKEYVVKTIWNSTANMVKEKYFNDYNIVIDPFSDIIFKEARDARNAKRKELQKLPEKRKLSSSALDKSEILKMAKSWDENDPEGLQKKFFHIASFELAWRGGEAPNCKIHFFKKEILNDGTTTGRIEYNSIFSKTAQGGSKKCSESKWLTMNKADPDICPVRLFNKMIEKRPKHINTDRLFLTVNPFWQTENSKGWFKNMPIGKNEMSKWTKSSASKIGLDVKEKKKQIIQTGQVQFQHCLKQE